MEKIKVKIGNEGIAIGKIKFINDNYIPEKNLINDSTKEIDKLDKVIESLSKTYDEKINEYKTSNDKKVIDSIKIIEAKAMMLKDEALIKAIKDKINNESVNIEYAIYVAAEKIANDFLNSNSDYMKGRSADIKDISKQLINELIGNNEKFDLTEEAILYANDISPEQILSYDKKFIKAIITKKGFAMSHTSILAGTYDIPYIFGVSVKKEKITDKIVIVNANDGELILDPNDKEIESYKNEIAKKQNENTEKIDKFYDEYKDRVKFYANIASINDLNMAIEKKAEGVGLFRTEFLFMNREDLPNEEEQFNIYKKVAEEMVGKEVIIRTLDIGADKKTECIKLTSEENPALGVRAIRLCFKYEDIFKTQLKALFRASKYGNIKIMYPMIASIWEVENIKKYVKEVEKELNNNKIEYKIPKQGIMIEIPSAALCSDELAKMVDFFSIGTNDLTQYTLACDRCNEEMDKYFNSKHEAIFKLIEMTVKNAHKNGIEVGICGELGGDKEAVERLVKLGIDELSMSASKIEGSKKVLYNYYLNKDSNEKAIKNKLEEKLYAPADGKFIEMKDIPDEAFSTGLLGKCIGIYPENDNIYAPCDGEITMIADTKHFINIKSNYGNNVFLHVGINTVSLKGKGFDVKVKVGDKVKQGDVIMMEDVKFVEDNNLSPIVILGIS